MQAMLVEDYVEESELADSASGRGGGGNIVFDAAAPMDFEDDFDGVPIDIPVGWSFTGCTSTGNGTTWTYESLEDASQCATAVLEALESSGASLMESGYLDISNKAWGCAADMNDGSSSVMVTMIPNNGSNEEAKLVIRVVVLDAAKVSQNVFSQK